MINRGGVKPVLFQLPVNYSDWQYDAHRSLNWQPVVQNPDENVSCGYSSGKKFVQLNIAYYQKQRRGAEAISTSNKLTNPYGGEWKLISSADVSESNKHFTESALKYAGEKLLVWSWYRVGKYETPDPYMAKVLEAYNLIIEGRSDISIVSIATRFDDTKVMARQKIYDFWRKSASNITNRFEQIQNEK